MGKNNSESWDEIADRLTKSANNYVDELEYITEEANKMNEIMHYYDSYIWSINDMIKSINNDCLCEDVIEKFYSYLSSGRRMKKMHSFMNDYSTFLDDEIMGLSQSMKEVIDEMTDGELEIDRKELLEMLYDLKDCAVEYMRDLIEIVEKQKKQWKKKHPVLFRKL